MKLKDQDIQPPLGGLPGARREWWDLGEGYEIFASIGNKYCTVGIDGPNKKDITLEVAEYLGVDTAKEHITFGAKGRELYVSPSIDCVALHYVYPEKYQELLKKIEHVIDKYYKKR